MQWGVAPLGNVERLWDQCADRARGDGEAGRQLALTERADHSAIGRQYDHDDQRVSVDASPKLLAAIGWAVGRVGWFEQIDVRRYERGHVRSPSRRVDTNAFG
jgi:hypothetical protein